MKTLNVLKILARLFWPYTLLYNIVSLCNVFLNSPHAAVLRFSTLQLYTMAPVMFLLLGIRLYLSFKQVRY